MTKNKYDFTLEELRTLMELRGQEGHQKVEEYGGPLKICEKLKTSPQNGVNSDDTDTGYRIYIN